MEIPIIIPQKNSTRFPEASLKTTPENPPQLPALVRLTCSRSSKYAGTAPGFTSSASLALASFSWCAWRSGQQDPTRRFCLPNKTRVVVVVFWCVLPKKKVCIHLHVGLYVVRDERLYLFLGSDGSLNTHWCVRCIAYISYMMYNLTLLEYITDLTCYSPCHLACGPPPVEDPSQGTAQQKGIRVTSGTIWNKQLLGCPRKLVNG